MAAGPAARTRIRIGVDTGGTFTDLLLDAGDGRPLLEHKLLSTPQDPAKAVTRGVLEILGKLVAGSPPLPAGPAPLVIHGSTVATNALLEGKGARVAFVTTAGFEDTLFIARQTRPELYALEPVKPALPLADEQALGVHERVDAAGQVVAPLSEAEIERVSQAVADLGVEAVCLSLLHSYLRPEHERMLGRRLRETLPGVHVTVSHELLPEYREYERAATCLVNASVAPAMGRYIGRLAAELGAGNLRVMASAGGSLPPEIIVTAPAQTILSGPAGGVVGAQAQARRAGVEAFISLDMGGTSTDVALCDGEMRLSTETEIAGLPVRLPSLAIHTVGAGGGSIAWLDEGGALRVGPRSLGADPGPACYGRQEGPPIPAVTDAHLVLGHLSASRPLAGGLKLDLQAARQGVGELARRAGLSLEACAEGILRVAEVTMARAVGRISLERGYDTRRFTLLPFGGAGGLSAARLAEGLGMSRVLVPRQAGLLSALGMLSAGPLYTFSQGLMLRLEDPAIQAPPINEIPLLRQARATLTARAQQALTVEGIAPERRQLSASLDLRYVGQSFELNIPLDVADPLADFAERHRQLYGYSTPNAPVELVTLRLTARGLEPEQEPAAIPSRSEAGGAPALERCKVYSEGRWIEAQRTQRAALLAGDALDGPLIVDEYSATTLVPSGWRMEVNPWGQLLLTTATSEAERC